MADFNRRLKERKVLVYFTIIAFFHLSCLAGCSKAKDRGQPGSSAAAAAGEVENKEDPCGCPPAESGDEPDVAQQGPAVQLTEKQIADRLDRYSKALEKSKGEIPRDTFEPRAIIDKVGPEPKDLFVWVRDNTRLVPYKGVLRGAKGVLMDRFGNSLDRALLLSELIESAGHRVRLARATLPREKAAEVLRVLSSPASRASLDGQETRTSMAETIEEQALAYGLDAKQLREANEAFSRDSYRSATEVRVRAAEQSGRLVQAVGTPPEARELAETERRAFTEALRDHWWVQVENEASWLELDPALPETPPGQRLIEASELVLPEELDDRDFHTVEIRLVIERWEAGRLVKKPVLESSFRPFELMGEAVAVNHVPMNWPDDASVFAGEDAAERLKTLVLEEHEWLPVLRLGSRQVTASSFKDTGEIDRQPGKKGGAGIGGVAGGIFGALGGKEEEPESEKETLLTAEWIEYEIHSPGVPVRKYEREVFDIVGPVRRMAGKLPDFEITEADRLERGLAMLAGFDILVQSCSLSPEFMTHLLASRLLENWSALSGLFQEETSNERFFDRIQQLAPLPGPEYGFASGRREWSPVGDETFFGGPNIAAFVSGVRLSAEESLLSYRAIDIVENRVEVLPNARTGPFEARLRQGVLDTNAEDAVIDGLGRKAKGTARLYAESGSQGVAWVAVRSARDPSLKQLDLPEGARSRIEKDLAAGHIVVAPQKSVNVAGEFVVGWWRVDPRTGQTLGMSDNGWGQGMTEHKLLWGFKIAGWTMCGIETAMAVGEQASGHTPHPVTAVFLGSCWALGITSMTMALAGYHGVAAWVIVIVEIQSFFMGLGVHAGMAQGSGEKKASS